MQVEGNNKIHIKRYREGECVKRERRGIEGGRGREREGKGEREGQGEKEVEGEGEEETDGRRTDIHRKGKYMDIILQTMGANYG